MQLRVTFLSAFLFALCSALAQPPSGQGGNTDAQGRKQGPWSRSWPDGKLRYSGQFKDDKPVGKFQHFDAGGKLTSIQLHAGDGHVSRAEHFHENGNLMAVGKYVDQKKDSTWNYYGADGKLRKVERYRLGELNGEQVTYYPGGQVAESEMRENGILHGANRSWFANGKLKTEATYQRGEPEGRMVFYFPDGKKEIEGSMVNGDRDGTWYYFNADGSLQMQSLYRRGEPIKERKENGVFKEYFEDEQLKSEVTYKNGKREGRFTEYHDNGRWVLKPMRPDPVMGGPADVERVLEGQTKRREGMYVNDLLEGEVKEYDTAGKLVRTENYVAGVAGR